MSEDIFDTIEDMVADVGKDMCVCGHDRDGHADNTGRCECGWFSLTPTANPFRFCKCRRFTSKG